MNFDRHFNEKFDGRRKRPFNPLESCFYRNSEFSLSSIMSSDSVKRSAMTYQIFERYLVYYTYQFAFERSQIFEIKVNNLIPDIVFIFHNRNRRFFNP